MSRLICTACSLVFLLLLTNGKTFGNIIVTTTETDVSTAVFDPAGQLIYDGSIGVTVSGGVAPYTFTLVLPSGKNVQQRNGYFPSLDAGIYIINAADASGQTITSKVTVNYKYPQPAVTASNIVIPGCTKDGGFTLNGSGGTPPYVYSIDGGTVYTGSNTFINLAQGDYVILIKDAHQQIGMIAANPTSSIAGFLGLFGTSCYLSASAHFAASTCADQGSLHVSLSSHTATNSFSLDGINYHSLNPDPTFPSLYEYDSSGLAPGLYDFYLKDKLGDQSIYAYVIVKFCTIPVSFTEMNASCGQSDGSLTVMATEGVPPYSYSMDGVNYQASNLFTGLPSGNYAITVKDINGLTSSTTGTLDDNCLMSISALTVNAACGNQKGSVTVTIKGGAAPYSYSIDGSTFQANDSFSNLDPGRYTVTVKDNSGLTVQAPVIVGITTVPQLSAISAAASCSNNDGSITLTGLGGTSPFQYSLDGIVYQNSDIFRGLASGDYTPFIKDANGCTASQPVTVPLDKEPVKVFAGHDTAVLINQPLLLHAVDVDHIGFTQYQWSPPDGLNNPGIQDPVATPAVSTIYTVRVTTAAGCEGTAALSVKVFTAYDLYVPNAFTPNGDGHNDILRVMPVGIREFFYFAVFNRLGQRIFYSTNPSAGWDGTLNGKTQMSGVYIWMSAGVDFRGKKIERRGTVMLIR